MIYTDKVILALFYRQIMNKWFTTHSMYVEVYRYVLAKDAWGKEVGNYFAPNAGKLFSSSIENFPPFL